MVVSESNGCHGSECVVDGDYGDFPVCLLVKFKAFVGQEFFGILGVGFPEVRTVHEVLDSVANDEPGHSELESEEEDNVNQLHAFQCERNVPLLLVEVDVVRESL